MLCLFGHLFCGQRRSFTNARRLRMGLTTERNIKSQKKANSVHCSFSPQGAPKGTILELSSAI
jgi:hypothetical protein